jgi:ribosomal protein L18
MIDSKKRMLRRRERDLAKHGSSEHRVVLFRSNRYIYASLVRGNSVVGQVSTLSGAPGAIKGKTNQAACEWVGMKLVEYLKAEQLTKVFVSKSGYKFHGGIRRLIEVLREGGVQC